MARRALVLLAAPLLAACGEMVTQIGPEDVVELAISADSLRVPVGRTRSVIAQPLDSTGALLVGQHVSFASRDPQVASVDEEGLVTGVASGSTWVVATVAGLGDSTHVTVAPAPLLVFSDDAVELAGSAGAAAPLGATVDVTNGGAFPLLGLAVDSVVHGAGADGWLSAQLDGTTAPATLTLSASVAGVTAAGSYGATVWLSGADADGSPASVAVTLVVAPGAAASISVNGGDGQSAAVDTEVATPPSVLVLDAFDNPVSGVSVQFAVTEGGGSLTGATPSTDGEGIATVGSWRLGTTAGTNEVTATLGSLPAVTFTAEGEPGAATQLVVVEGDGQGAIAGNAVLVDPRVSVTDDHGNPVEGVQVTFEVTAGGGVVDPQGPVSTDAGGQAAVTSWTLGGAAGTNTLRATATGIAAPVTFTATGLTDAAALQLVSGDMQLDSVAATLADYVVRVVDGGGNGVAGVPVSWRVLSGGGSITTPTTTDADGYASATRVLGETPGTHTAEAVIPGLPAVAFAATASVGSADRVVVVQGDAQTATVATAVPTAPRVRVVDKFGNPIAGHSVTFEVTAGSGTVDPETAIATGADGLATVASWTLGTVAGTGNQALRATATGLAPVTLTASATPDEPAGISVAAGSGQTAVTGTNVTAAPTALVEDQFGNAVPDVTVLFTTTGGSVGSPSTPTDANGRAATSWAPSTAGGTMQPDGTFPDTLVATVEGTGLTTSFTGAAVYSYVAHVDPVFAGCSGCHAGTSGGLSGLSLGGTPSQNHAQLTVDAPPVCDATLTTYRRVSTAGATTGWDSSLVPIVTTPAIVGTCGYPGHPQLSAAQRALVEAWIRNGAPFN